jgi:hypothetical protein
MSPASPPHRDHTATRKWKLLWWGSLAWSFMIRRPKPDNHRPRESRRHLHTATLSMAGAGRGARSTV